MYNLYDLPIDISGIVKEINCSGSLKRRFLDLGIIKNTIITPILRSPSGDPTAFEIRGSLIAIRKEDALLIKVKPIFSKV